MHTPKEAPTEHAFKYVFGPVMSRRLGRSLGVDVVPFKTCTYDCVYCQLGQTTHLTLDRKEYVPLEDVLDEVRRKLAGGVQADCVTVAGSGEPTLYSRLGELLEGIKALTGAPIVLLTNGSLFWMREVQDAALKADIVIPSLDAGRALAFGHVNRPVQGISFEKMVEGLVEFRERYTGQLWLEVFLLKQTAGEAELGELTRMIRRIHPDKVQLNTVARPTPGREVYPVPPDELEQIARRIGPNAEVIARYEAAPPGGDAAPAAAVAAEDVLALIRRHPDTLDNLAEGLGAAPATVLQHVAALLEQGAIREERTGAEVFYVAT